MRRRRGATGGWEGRTIDCVVAEQAGEEAPQGEGRCGGDGRPAGTPPSRAVAVVVVLEVPPLRPLVTANTYVYDVAHPKTRSP